MTSTSCPICLKWHRPIKILDCGHNFCYRCIRNVRRERPVGQFDPIYPKYALRCPFCREQHVVPIGGVRNLPTNIAFEKELLGKGIIDEDEDEKSKNASLSDGGSYQWSLETTWNTNSWRYRPLGSRPHILAMPRREPPEYDWAWMNRNASSLIWAPASRFVRWYSRGYEQRPRAGRLRSFDLSSESITSSSIARTIDDVDWDDWLEDEHRLPSSSQRSMSFDEDQAMGGNSWHPSRNLDGSVDCEVSLPSIGDNGIPQIDELSDFEVDALSVSVADCLANPSASEDELSQ